MVYKNIRDRIIVYFENKENLHRIIAMIIYNYR